MNLENADYTGQQRSRSQTQQTQQPKPLFAQMVKNAAIKNAKCDGTGHEYKNDKSYAGRPKRSCIPHD